MRTPLMNSIRTAATMGGLVWLAACTATTKESGLTIEKYITHVSDGTGAIVATLHKGDAPQAGGGPTSTVTGFPAMVNGGSSKQTVDGASAFNRVIVQVPGATNYYELLVPDSVTRELVLVASPDLPDMSLPVAYAVGDAQGLGAYSTLNTRVIHVGNGDVQVSVSWSDSSDVDLHVLDPSGEEIYYSHHTSASGGNLDLDSNAGCAPSGGTFKSNENVVWPTGQGAQGTYTVRLDYWSSCSATKPTEYVVTVATVGSQPLLFTGTLSGAGDHGGAGSGNLITTFTF